MAAVAERNEHKSDEGAAPQRLLGSGPRRWRWLAAGAALMAVGAAAVATALGQVDDRSGVVAAARDLPAGHVVVEGDLQVVEIAGGEQLAAVPAARIDGLVGKTVLAPINQNTLIAPEALGSGDAHPAEGEAVIGASLAPNQMPSSVRAGARVAVVITSAPGEDGSPASGGEQTQGSPPPSPAASAQEAISGRVQSVTTPEDAAGGQATRVELVVDAADAEAVARAAAADALSVVEVSGGES
ncbi:SAF domain-containing protein [Streptomonospora salina]|uniref:SAF domain-containing protein n=1 Tax=Streptomonospora salina TaxID=104205 RepID=A0A841E9U5_9ACTN|nr:SAF domain-containing protein [Streptomonospora salina]MBB5998079.1 hypothetical protein [Streptomonospora salina]